MRQIAETLPEDVFVVSKDMSMIAVAFLAEVSKNIVLHAISCL